MQSLLCVSRSFYYQYPQPYSDCGVLEEDNKLVVQLADRTIFDMVAEATAERPYTRKACLSTCTQMRTVQVCGCNTRRISFQESSAEACSMDEELNCALGVWKASESLHAYCSSRCPIECSQSEFKVDIIYAQPSLVSYGLDFYFSQFYWCEYWNLHGLGTPISSDLECENLELRYLDYSKFYQDIAQVAFKYETLSSIESEEVPKISGEQLLGIIGGHLSLLLGMSLLSFVELVEFAMFLVTSWYSSLASKQEDPNSKQRFHLAKKLVSHETRKDAERLKMAALPNAIRSNHPFLSAFWFIMLLAIVAFCSYLIVESIHEFEAHEVTTSVAIEKVDEPEFPVFTVCNLHPFTTSFADSFFHSVSFDYNYLSYSYSTGGEYRFVLVVLIVNVTFSKHIFYQSAHKKQNNITYQ